MFCSVFPRFAYLFVFVELRLELGDARSQFADHRARLVLVRHDLVLDVLRPIRVIERAERLGEVDVARRCARNHQRAAETG